MVRTFNLGSINNVFSGISYFMEAILKANMVRAIAEDPPSKMRLTSIPCQSSKQIYVSWNNFEKKEITINSIFTECLRFLFFIQESLKVLKSLIEN